MNHFERLVRRAMLRPAERPGAAIVDPFERTEEWLLDEVPRVATRAPFAPQFPPVVRREPALHDSTPATERPAVEPSEAPTRINAPREPAPPDPVAITQVVHDAPREEDGPSVLLTPSVQPPASEAVALAHADAFLRNLGVRVPEAPSDPIAHVMTPAREQAPEREHCEPPDTRSSQVISPPAVTHKAPPASPPQARSAVDPQRVIQQSDPPTEPVSGARAPILTREIVLVDRPAAGREQGGRATAGVGSPHIGLGQL